MKQRKEINTQSECEGGGVKGVSIVTAVHGWRHSAAIADSNLKDLKSVLELTYGFEKKGPYSLKCGAREVVGVYIGWRGISSSTSAFFGKNVLEDYDPVELLSFWDRKVAAQNVSMGSVRELLSVLQQFVKQRNDPTISSEENETKKSHKDICIKDYEKVGWECKLDRLIIVGHSFGGLIVFNALSESLLNSITAGTLHSDKRDKIYNPEKVRLQADLVVLVNPAIEGARFEPIYQAIKRRDLNYSTDSSAIKGRGFNKYQQPVLAAITAANDSATRFWFPKARFFTAMNESKTPRSRKLIEPNSFGDIEVERFISDNKLRYEEMSSEEHEANNKTIGHIERYWTHILDIDNAANADAVKVKTDCENWDDCRAKKSMRGYYLESKKGKNSCLFCQTLKLEYQDKGLPYNSPVWIIRSEDKGFLNNHGGYDVNRHSIMPFLRQLYHQLVFSDVIFNDETINDDQCKPPMTEPMPQSSTPRPTGMSANSAYYPPSPARGDSVYGLDTQPPAYLGQAHPR